MINLFNLSPKAPRLILIPGLNNSGKSFHELRDLLISHDFDCKLLTLPGHGSDRSEMRELKSSFRAFNESMKELIQEPYVVIAFSHGALLLQLWLEKNQCPKPMAQILLAPALYVHRYDFFTKLSKKLPGVLPLPSQMPLKMRRYHTILVSEYRTLLEAVKTYQALKVPFRIPTLIMVDPKDELVSALELKEKNDGQENVQVILHTRPKLKRGLGVHHILFSSEYFEKKDWEQFCQQMEDFLKAHLK